MTTNLLTNYMHNNINKPAVSPKPKSQQDVEIVNVVRTKPDFDINRELANRTFIKPLPPKARIVKSGIFDAPAIFVKDALYDIKALKDGWEGKANDHQLGKLNDLGMKIGGLAIASYLFTKKHTPVTKAMEFVGLGSFFASMALWPKIGLQIPARLIHGINVMPEYEDSYGRKKPFYQDNLFIPWDAYSDEEIHKYGDRLGIPRDIPNRREFIQEKMRKIALQNNTMWMLTAGFATPVMSALMCKAAEKPVTHLLDKYYSKKADKMLLDFSKNTEKAKTNTIIDAVDRLIELNKEKPVDKKMIESFAMALGGERDMLTVRAIEKDLTRIMLGGDREFRIKKELIGGLIKKAGLALEDKFSKEIINAIVPSHEQITGHFEDADVLKKLEVSGIIGNNLNKSQILNVSMEFEQLVRSNIKKYNAAHPDKPLRADAEIPLILKRINGTTAESGIAFEHLQTLPKTKLDAKSIRLIETLRDIMTEFNAEGRVLDKYAALKYGETSNLANYWNDVDSSVLKILNFSDKELNIIKNDRKLVTPILREKLESIASDKQEYERVLDAICKKLAKIGETIKDNTISQDYKELSDSVYDRTAEKLRHIALSEDQNAKEISMSSLIKELVGFDELQKRQKEHPEWNVKTFSQKDIQKSFAEGRLLSVNSSFRRIINTLDLYRRIATLKNLDIKNIAGAIQSINQSTIPLEVKEELLDIVKNLQLDAHMSDFETKFFTLRNPNPDTSEGALTVKDGKVVNRFFNKSKAVKKVDIPSDPLFFHNLINLLYGNEMLEETSDILVRNKILGMKEYRTSMMRDVADTDYFAKKFHKIFTAYKEGSKASSERKFFTIGKSVTDLISDCAKQKYNTKQWLKMFGGIGAGLFAITVASQFLFGKLELPQQQKKG